MKPNPNNFCGGNFQDWLEVNLTDKCNGRCAWCIEKNGYHPKEHASWRTIVSQALKSGKANIILLGGEPTLYPDLAKIIKALLCNRRKVWITTNGGLLSADYVVNSLIGIAGINISIHDSDLEKNREITGITISNLRQTIASLHAIGASVRLNCNCILGHIDSAGSIKKYIAFAKSVGADKVRLAELKLDGEKFVDLAEVLDHQHGLNDDPFTFGCQIDTVIDGLPVNFRQMCGLQTPKRPKPIEPEQFGKQVLYYDGKFYDGWQMDPTNKEIGKMTKEQLEKLFESVAKGKIKPAEAIEKIYDGAELHELYDEKYGCNY